MKMHNVLGLIVCLQVCGGPVVASQRQQLRTAQEIEQKMHADAINDYALFCTVQKMRFAASQLTNKAFIEKRAEGSFVNGALWFDPCGRNYTRQGLWLHFCDKDNFITLYTPWGEINIAKVNISRAKLHCWVACKKALMQLFKFGGIYKNTCKECSAYEITTFENQELPGAFFASAALNSQEMLAASAAWNMHAIKYQQAEEEQRRINGR